MLYVLEKWIAMRTVSGNTKYMEECRRGARFLKNILLQLGAIPGACGRTLVYGKFIGKHRSNDKSVPTVLIYGYYDVIAAENENNLWGTDPFNMTGRNGYLYGRGTSDNKGKYPSIYFFFLFKTNHNLYIIGINPCIDFCSERVVKGRSFGCKCHLFN
ncbi:uncharacterized protein EV154DRAFT_414094 [Mucor mucedo]|uniref:uncharacterized protein n=1 Tax=Mucor mucedo TaxID=29922 RepID=UPI00221F613D|nr:uncharacterized protein EV154DRAFT_414094 [Mucor mucedo]KAI7894995.1 hypothetical protein EV154DRAFT_414094 [Mucor mucedo]